MRIGGNIDDLVHTPITGWLIESVRILSSNGGFNVLSSNIISGDEEVGSKRGDVVGFEGSNDNGDVNGDLIWASVFSVDLSRCDDVSSDDFSGDDSVWLVNIRAWCQEMSLEIGFGDGDGSSTSNNIVNDSTWNSGERGSRDSNVFGSSDVDVPSGLEVAVSSGGVSER